MAQHLVGACDALRTLAESLAPRPVPGSLAEKYPWLTIPPSDEWGPCEDAMYNWLGAIAKGQHELGQRLESLPDDLRGVLPPQTIAGLPDDAERAPSYHEAAYWVARHMLATVYGYAPAGTPAADWFISAGKYRIDWLSAAAELRESARLDAQQLQKLIVQESAKAIRRLRAVPTPQSAPEIPVPPGLEKDDVKILEALARRKGIVAYQADITEVGRDRATERLAYLAELEYVTNPPGKTKRGWLITGKGLARLEELPAVD